MDFAQSLHRLTLNPSTSCVDLWVSDISFQEPPFQVLGASNSSFAALNLFDMGLAPTLKQLPNPVDSSDAMGNRLSLQNLSISSTSIPSTSSGSGPPQAGVTDDDQGGACEPTQSPSSNTITNTASPATVEATQSSDESDPPPPPKRLKTSRVAPNSRYVELRTSGRHIPLFTTVFDHMLMGTGGAKRTTRCFTSATWRDASRRSP